MKKILFILTSLKMGGAENLTVNIIERLDKTKYDVTVLSYAPLSETPLEQRLQNMNVKIKTIYRRFKYDISVFARIKSFIKKLKPDVVHTHSTTLAYALYGVKKAHIKNLIDTTHSMACHDYPRKFHRKVYNKAFHKYGVTPVAIGSQVKLSMMEMFGLDDNQIVTIVNGIDLRKFLPKENYQPDKELVTVARLEPIKNQILSIRAMRFVVDKQPDVKLFLYGSGSQQDALQEEIRKLQLSENVFLCGSTTAVPSVLQKHDIYLSTSKVEGLPLGFVEAMAVGLPIIATNVGGVPDVVSDGNNGILINSFDEQEIANAIIELISDKERCEKIRVENLKKSKQFDLDVMVKKYEELYQR